MAEVSIQLGDIFLINTPKKPHYYIAIAPTNNNQFLFVSIITRKPKSDSACVLIPGETVPSFIVTESVIDYQYAREINTKQISRIIVPDSLKYSCDQAILKKIQCGGLNSKKLKNKYKNILKSLLKML
jgi:hypothetical protein